MMATQQSLRGGCRVHAMSAAEVRRWWERAEAKDAEVGVCGCCLGPCPVQWAVLDADAEVADLISVRDYCKRCEEVAA